MRKYLFLILLFWCSIANASDMVDGYEATEQEVSIWDAIAASSVSATNTGRAYYNGTSDTLKLSLNGGSYYDLITSNTLPATITDYWKTTTAQTGLTGDKTGSFNLATSANLTATNVYSTHLIAPSLNRLDIEGADGIAGSVNGQNLYIRPGFSLTGSSGNGGNVLFYGGVADGSGNGGNMSIYGGIAAGAGNGGNAAFYGGYSYGGGAGGNLTLYGGSGSPAGSVIITGKFNPSGITGNVDWGSNNHTTTGTFGAGAITSSTLTSTYLPVIGTAGLLQNSAGTGFVKATAGVVSYDNSTYLTKATDKITRSIVIGDDGSGWLSAEIPLTPLADVACTITAIRASVLGTGSPTIAFKIEERPWGTDITTAGTDIINAGITADNDGIEVTSFDNAGIAAKAHLVLTTAGSGVVSGTTQDALIIDIDYTKD